MTAEEEESGEKRGGKTKSVSKSCGDEGKSPCGGPTAH